MSNEFLGAYVHAYVALFYSGCPYSGVLPSKLMEVIGYALSMFGRRLNVICRVVVSGRRLTHIYTDWYIVFVSPPSVFGGPSGGPCGGCGGGRFKSPAISCGGHNTRQSPNECPGVHQHTTSRLCCGFALNNLERPVTT